jgi:hypothetical protein
MPLVARAAAAACVAALCAVVTACGGSVADTDLREARAATATRAPAASPFCAASRASSAAIGPLNALVGRGQVNPADLAQAVDAVRRAEADLLSTAPPEVRADVQTTVDAVDAQLDALVRHGGDGAATNADPALTARLGAPELAAANQRLTAYLTRTCSGTRS